MSSIGRSWVRFSLLAFLLVATFGLLKARDREEILPAHSNLSGFPLTIADWHGKDLSMNSEILEVLGPGDFLLRDYFDVSQQQATNLFIAFFSSQRKGDTIHSPKNCLPGAGWIPVESARIWVDGPDGHKIEVNRYLIEKGSDRAVVLYWYQAHGQATPSEYRAKYRLVADAIAMNRSDGALIRVSTFLQHGESLSHAEARDIAFAQLAMPLLDRYIPR
jgi:EpsI family protein